MPPTDFRVYTGWTISELLDRLAEIYTELAGLAVEYATVLVAERRAKVLGFQQSEEPTVAGRERFADFQSLDLTVAAIEVRGQTHALEQERDLLVRLLER